MVRMEEHDHLVKGSNAVKFEEDYKLGDTITVEHFIEGEFVDIANGGIELHLGQLSRLAGELQARLVDMVAV